MLIERWITSSQNIYTFWLATFLLKNEPLVQKVCCWILELCHSIASAKVIWIFYPLIKSVYPVLLCNMWDSKPVLWSKHESKLLYWFTLINSTNSRLVLNNWKNLKKLEGKGEFMLIMYTKHNMYNILLTIYTICFLIEIFPWNCKLVSFFSKSLNK